MKATPKHLITEGIPSNAQYQTLYSLIGEFRAEKPYTHIGSEYCFGIRQESKGEELGDIHWCVIMGKGGEEFGASIFYSDQSLDAFYTLVNDPRCPDSFPFRDLDGTYFNLVNKKELDTVDIANFKEREFTTYGRGKGWPLVRRYLPGHIMSEFITEKDINATVQLIQLLPSIISDIKSRKVSFESESEEEQFPVLSVDTNGKRHWEMVEPQFDSKPIEQVKYDNFRANRAKKLKMKEQGIFIGSPLLFAPTGEVMPPILPEALFVINADNGVIMDFKIIEYGNDYNLERINSFIGSLIDWEFRPNIILVDNEHLVKPLEEIFNGTDTDVLCVDSPEPYFEMLDEMMMMMNSGR